MSYVTWLLDEAWEHRRRRYRRLAFAILAAAAAVTLGLLASSRDHNFATSGTAPRSQAVTPSRVLSGPVYLGVRCPIANSIACDRVGLAVSLKRPAISVSATIAGAPVNLDWFGDQRLSSGSQHREFDGYLQPAGIVSRLHIRPVEGTEVLTEGGRTRLVNSPQMWFGEGDARPALVRLTIHYAGGRVLTTQLHVALATGWG
jgi:hypothetical protein